MKLRRSEEFNRDKMTPFFDSISLVHTNLFFFVWS